MTKSLVPFREGLSGKVFSKLLNLTGLTSKVNYQRRVYIKKAWLRIPVIQGIWCAITETWMIDVLALLLREQEGAFLDIGVNLGQTLIKVKALLPDIIYIGFEPNPVCINYVNELIKNNSFENCTLVPVGIFSSPKVLALDLYSDNLVDSAASMIEGFRPDEAIYHRMLVPVMGYESLGHIIGIQKVGILKIDVEGAELEIVKSLYPIIQSHRPIILLEVLPIYSLDNEMRKQRQYELERLFNNAGYCIFRVAKTPSDAYAGLVLIKEIGIHSNINQCDYVFVPNELLAKIQRIAAVSFELA